MEPFDLHWAAASMHASDILLDAGEPTSQSIYRLRVSSIITDSRNARNGALFFALRGERSDGHVYLRQIAGHGAFGVVSEQYRRTEVQQAPGVQVVVRDPLTALGDLASAYRGNFSLPVIGITGSVGKTSTKDMTFAILQDQFRTVANEKNYNNEIGLPLTLFRLNRDHEVAIVEMGMRARDEIRRLAEIARPRIAIITNVGYAHIEILGSRIEIAKAKGELPAMLPTDGSAVVIVPDNLDFADDVLREAPANCRIVKVGSKGSDLWSEHNKSPGGFRVHVAATQEWADVHLNVPGVHHQSNALLAIAAALEMNVSLKSAADSLSRWAGSEGRMTVRKGRRGITVLDDCYNAGIESMCAALTTLGAYPGEHVAVLGDMRELGAAAMDLHRRVGEHLASVDVRTVITVGELAQHIGETAMQHIGVTRQMEHIAFTSTSECAARIEELIKVDDVVLVKGSRALAMEAIVSRLTGEASADHHA